MNDNAKISLTLERFEYPKLLIADYPHWAVLLRRHQVTLGSLVLSTKSEVTAWPDVGQDAFTELAQVTAAIERTLQSRFRYDKINYMMLMMVDPNPHFHVFRRYAESMTLDDDLAAKLLDYVKAAWDDDL